MATLAELVKGFRHNVREGYQSTLIFTGDQIHLTCENPKGYVGISTKPSHKEIEIIFNAEQTDYIRRDAKLQADVAIMEALKEIVSIYLCYTDSDKNLIRAIKHTVERINRPYLSRTYPPDESLVEPL